MIRRSFWYSMTHAAPLALSAALAGCGAAEEGADGPPVFGASNPSAPGGNSGTPQNPASGSAGATNPNNPSQAAGSGSTPSASPGGSAAPSGTEGNGNPNAPLDPSTASNSGGAMAPGTGGAGSMPSGGQQPSGAAGAPPVTNPPVTTPATPDIACPAGAIFCSGFEGTTLPAGTTFEPSYLAPTALGAQVTLDTAVFHGGRQSLKMPVGNQFNYYRMLAVSVPTSFWVRLYTRSNVGFGAEGSTHASLYMGSILPPGEYNGDGAIEIAEQFTQIQLNKNDARYGTSGLSPAPTSTGTTLPDNTWTCMETEFDGATGAVRVFVEGDQIIDASDWQPPTAYKTFRFGYLRFDSPPRDVWMDDVVVTANRVGCL